MADDATTEGIAPAHLTRRSFLAAGVAAAAASTLAWPAAAAPRILRERELHIQNAHTGEAFRDVYWANGRQVPTAFKRLRWLMRDFRTDEVVAIDPTLIDLLYGIQTRVGHGKPLVLLSGYRSPETNQVLMSEGHAVAENSMHVVGKAADIHIQGVQLRYVSRAAMSFRAGGVGTYWHNNFVHVDTGRVRFW
jgi:uncharacterized protein YcbK (DUF882 family)